MMIMIGGEGPGPTTHDSWRERESEEKEQMKQNNKSKKTKGALAIHARSARPSIITYLHVPRPRH